MHHVLNVLGPLPKAKRGQRFIQVALPPTNHSSVKAEGDAAQSTRLTLNTVPVTISTVFVFPPSDSFNKCVNLLSRYLHIAVKVKRQSQK